jgi:hypothetical protein
VLREIIVEAGAMIVRSSISRIAAHRGVDHVTEQDTLVGLRFRAIRICVGIA